MHEDDHEIINARLDEINEHLDELQRRVEEIERRLPAPSED